MAEIKNKTSKNQFKSWFILAAIFLVVGLASAGFSLGLGVAYDQKIYAGVKIGNLDVSSLTKEEILSQLSDIDEEFQKQGLVFSAEDKKISVNPIVISESPDLAQEILVVDWKNTAERAYRVGRSGNFFQNLGSRVKTLVFGKRVMVDYYLDEAELIEHLLANFAELEKKPVNAGLEIKNGKAEITGEKSGYVFDYTKAANLLKSNIENLSFKPINLELVFSEPEIKQQFVGSALNSLDKILALESITLRYEKDSWGLTQDEFTAWLEFQLKDSEVVVGANKDLAVEYLSSIAEEVNVPTKDAKLKFSGTRVVEFQASQDGLALNIEETYKKLNEQIMLGDAADLPLVVEVEKAKVATGDLNDLGIKELLGRGTSNFSGSPVNRRHNIGVGVDTLNGILIKPNEEFSLIDALGEIDGENGYLQELVIKGDRTIPEYGGGLCQIGSTTFRAALWSGLPVTERRNHSYRVRYYEPAGMDATIYNPAPDMKFLNDTGYHILFIAKMSGDDLIFEFYGTPDGRKVTIDPNPPSIYNIVAPGPPRFIETDDLPPGEKKKVESSHPGADTYFKYTIEYPDGRIEEQDFYSHYVAWRETWLLGRDPNATTTDESVDISTDN